jgi:hypothetical protein
MKRVSSMISSNIDGPQAWVMVVAVFWNNAHHWGILSVGQPNR